MRAVLRSASPENGLPRSPEPGRTDVLPSGSLGSPWGVVNFRSEHDARKAYGTYHASRRWSTLTLMTTDRIAGNSWYGHVLSAQWYFCTSHGERIVGQKEANEVMFPLETFVQLSREELCFCTQKGTSERHVRPYRPAHHRPLGSSWSPDGRNSYHNLNISPPQVHPRPPRTSATRCDRIARHCAAGSEIRIHCMFIVDRLA